MSLIAPLRRVVRRETHSPRTAATCLVAVLAILGLAYVGTEIVLGLLDRPALLVSPADGVASVLGLPRQDPKWAIGVGGVLVMLVGGWLLGLGILPGRLPKHRLMCDAAAVVVDNGVIASALAHRLASVFGLKPDRVVVGVGHRSADVTIQPGAGFPVDREDIQAQAESELLVYQLVPRVKVRVRVLPDAEARGDR